MLSGSLWALRAQSLLSGTFQPVPFSSFKPLLLPHHQEPPKIEATSPLGTFPPTLASDPLSLLPSASLPLLKAF